MSNHPKVLTGAEVEQSRQRYGANVLTPPKRKSLWRLFFEKFNDPVIRILLVAALLAGEETIHGQAGSLRHEFSRCTRRAQVMF